MAEQWRTSPSCTSPPFKSLRSDAGGGGDAGGGYEATPKPPPAKLPPRRKAVTAACESCRRRKLRCDAARPKCFQCERSKLECVYLTEPSETRGSALRRTHARAEQELQGIRASNDAMLSIIQALGSSDGLGTSAILQEIRQGSDIVTILQQANQATLARRTDMKPKPALPAQHVDTRAAARLPSIHQWLPDTTQESQKELLELLQTMGEAESQELLHRIRSGEDAANLVRLAKNGHLLMQMALVPESRRRYQFPYFSKLPQYLSCVDQHYLGTFLSEFATKPQDVNQLPEPNPFMMDRNRHYTVPYLAAELVDPHLWNVKAAGWTNVIQDDQLLSRLLNSYFLHQYPIYLGFQKDYFLEDMAHGRTEFCSQLLVNSVLAAACRTYPGIPERAQFWNPQNLSYRFLAEAKRLWELQQGRSSLTAIQAAIILNITADSDTLDEMGKSYMLQAVAMAHDLDLFNPSPTMKSLRMQRARAFTAWSLYSWDVLQSFHYRHTPLIRQHPEIPFPEVAHDPSWYGELWIRYPLNGAVIPIHLGHVIYATLKMRCLIHDISLAFFGSKRTEQSITSELIDAFRSRLDQWFDQLPPPLTSEKLVLPVHMRVHMEYWSTMLILVEYQHNMHMTSDDPCQQTINRAYANIELLARVYYLRHSYDAYDPFMVYFLLLVGKRMIDLLASNVNPQDLESCRAMLVLCAKGIHEQGKNIYIAGMVYFALKGLMQPGEQNLLLTYVKETDGNNQNLIAEYNQSHWPLPIIKIHEGTEPALLVDLVKRYKELSVNRMGTSSSTPDSDVEITS